MKDTVHDGGLQGSKANHRTQREVAVVSRSRIVKSNEEEEVVSGRTEKLLQHRPYRVLNEE